MDNQPSSTRDPGTDNTADPVSGDDTGDTSSAEAGSRWGRELHGRELRSFLTVTLVDNIEPMRVRDLVAALHAAGFTVAGRASKVISDCLRWEGGRRRVRRLGRGVYQASTRIPRTTLRRLRSRVAELRDRAPGPVRTQPLRAPRPLVTPGPPRLIRRLHAAVRHDQTRHHEHARTPLTPALAPA